MVDVKKYSDVDFYGLLAIDISASEAEIRKAYRKKALECHPDKNPDNPKAAELFHELSKALEILSDASARAAYDKVLNAKKAAELRNKQLDSKRQKLKAELEQREREANSKLVKGPSKSYNVQKTPEEQLKDEIERLRKEGSRLLEEEQELMRQQLREERLKREHHFDSSQHRIKIKWKAAKDDPTNGGYNEETLRTYLKKYGEIVAMVVSSQKKGSALVEFKTQDAGEMAVSYEKGNLANPLTLQWIGNPPSKHGSSSTSSITDRDYESLVLRQMRQAEERKRLIEQMMKEEADS
ncbi:unnamed protein product [Hermetia illucens]|uniref:DnaJ homolog subfamily C member 17 n=1 Tax=Hermetia illucens TaxID=343691 RepID=A0A7R8Z3L3_HERIL|nr:dnaJ homolog subfamily C member 17 [Hermetia illucens]CAD7092102.1 unnamed protein product [Hermetia illucens]